MALTAKQQLFVKEYLIDQNGRRAGIAIGYPEKAAAAQASRLLKNANVAKAVAEGLLAQRNAAQRRANARGVTKDRWLRELERMAFTDMYDYARIETVKTEHWEGSDEKGKLVTTAHQELRVIDTAEQKPFAGRAVKKLIPGKYGVAVELQDKQRALDTIGKHYGWVKDVAIPINPAGDAQVHLHLYKNGSESDGKDE